jgi:hemerythrin superfamily protein
MNKAKIPTEQKSVLSLLLDDHRNVKKLFKEFEDEKNQAKKQGIVQEACAELTAHTKIEEEQFYPFLRDQDQETFGDLLDEALVEHASAKDLIRQLLGMAPGDDLYDAKFTVLGEYVNHHVTEEEDELFPKVIAQKVDLRELLSAMKQMKEAILSSSTA